MGDARRRKAIDPNYGKPRPTEPPSLPPAQTPKVNPLPDGARGIVVGCPISMQGAGLQIDHTGLDPQELRFSLLFWDKLVWPNNRFIFLGGGQDEAFLESIGIIERPLYNQGTGADIIVNAHLQAFLDVERNEPGAWALSQGVNSLINANSDSRTPRTALVKLFNCIPVPNQDVPLAELLEFKQRRSPELQALREVIGDFYNAISTSDDKAFAFRHAADRIDRACVDAVAVSRAAPFKFRMADVMATLAVPAVEKTVGGFLGDQLSLPGLIGSGIAASLACGIAARLRGVSDRNTPYRYVTQYHSEVFD